MPDRRIDVLFWIAFAFAFLLFPPAFLGLEVLSPERLLPVGSLAKLFFVVLAAFFSWRCLGRLDRDDAIRAPWALLAWGLGVYVLGQGSLSVYQVVLQVPSPFPSIADAFFVVSTFFLILALAAFWRAYARSGLPLVSKAEIAWIGGAGTLTLAVVLAFLLGNLGDELDMGGLLNVFYPVSDVFFLTFSLALFRVTWKLRGGRIWKVWISLVFAFVALAGGDIAFALFTEASSPFLDALIDLLFLWAYIALARGVVYQYQLVR